MPYRHNSAVMETAQQATYENEAEIAIRRNAGFAWQLPFSRRELAGIITAMRRAGAITAMPIELTLTDDVTISDTNEAYLACPGPTNILAFPPFAGFGPGLGTSSPGTGLLLLSLDAVERETLFYGQNTTEYALRLLAHGMAHLAGHDHGDVMDAFAQNLFIAGKTAWEDIRTGS